MAYGNSKKYLRALGVFLVKGDGLRETEWGGKQYINVAFKDALNRYIDAQFERRIVALPADTDEKTLSAVDKYQWKAMKKLLEIAGVPRLSQLEGKEVAVLIEPNHYISKNEKDFGQPKVMWKIGEYYKPSDLQGDVSNLGSGGDLGFL